ncbi:hypothetical protein [Methylobacterium frigidaeris]|uniref:Uncharacterized protein n=1 Tax=Methylobacterium frigidaeris TaxID=2038277 RepID=A0AA37HFI8_9HYPH|nr:hypothetical protein [Methylobacterium frigidaeris]PIK70889.1 hypothetical protein CS379_22245 [Methylobacterium frigidaeris]GJD65097.1 hypothetical protein MPEAHAMD_5283 [Methylobacterium frigidaeris]
MRALALTTLFAATLALPLAAASAALADGGGGGRMPAGGAHMSSYVHHPYHDPRSSHSQARGTGQLLGAPMMADPATRLLPRGAGVPAWAVQPRRR